MSQVNTNLTDIINAMIDGTADFAIGTISVAGATTLNGNVTLGNATADDITITGSIAATIAVKTNATYNFGSATAALLSVYLGNGTKSTRLLAGTVGTSWTFTLPNDVPTITGQTMVFNTSGTAEFRYPDKFTAIKTANYTATGDETVILCDPTTGGASFTVTLPAASTMSGKSLTIVKIDAGLTYTVTIDGNASETLWPSVQASNLTYILYSQYERITWKCNGTSWYATEHECATPWSSTATMTITGSTANPTKGTVVTDSVMWRRHGSYAEIRYSYDQSAGGSAGTGDYIYAAPSGITIDTTISPTFTTISAIIGTRAALNSILESTGVMTTGAVASTELDAYTYSSSTFRLCIASGASYVNHSATYFNFAAAFSFCFTIKVPVLGWNP